MGVGDFAAGFGGGCAKLPPADSIGIYSQPMRPEMPEYADQFELQVSIQDIRPAIWRRVRLPAEVTLGTLHDVLQIAFGWTNSHLHDFDINGITFGMVDVEDERFIVNENAAPLGAVARLGSRFTYLYDFGDSWEHEVTIERLLKRGGDSIECLDGARACPPEDCGGPGGYGRMLEILADPDDEEYPSMKQWVPRGYDPEKFNILAVNKKLATIAKRLGKKTKLRRV